MPKGNPNPSPETRFTSSGNPKGKTTEQRQAEVKAGEISAKLRLAALIRMQEMIESGEMDAVDLAKDGFLRLMKDSEDRAHGTPKASTEISGPDGLPASITLNIVKPDGSA